jgi:hypothetical protein
MSDLATRGYESAARVFDTAGQLVAWYNDATQSHCVRIEFVDERIRQQLELYIQTGRYDIKL